jgi:hypothetical protein
VSLLGRPCIDDQASIHITLALILMLCAALSVESAKVGPSKGIRKRTPELFFVPFLTNAALPCRGAFQGRIWQEQSVTSEFEN